MRTPAENYAHVKAWRLANPEKKKAQDRRARINNPLANSIRLKRWRARHPDKKRAECVLRRARKLAATIGDPAATQEFYTWLRETAIVICHWCRETVPQELRRADHFIPLVLGGAHSLDNLVPACDHCNLRKGSKLPEDFLLTRLA